MALATITRLGNNNEKLGLPERLSTGIQFRFRNLFHGKKSSNRNFIGKSSIWRPHVKKFKSRIKKILKRIYFKGPIRKNWGVAFWGIILKKLKKI